MPWRACFTDSSCQNSVYGKINLTFDMHQKWVAVWRPTSFFKETAKFRGHFIMKRTPAKPQQLLPAQIQQIESAVFALVEPLLDARFYLLNVTFEKDAGYWYLRIYLEGKDTPVSLSDCETVSRQIDASLDALPALKDLSYSLEVSSPGVFRPLKTQREFDFYQGRPVRIETLQSKKKTKQAPPKSSISGPEGVLKAYDINNQVLTLQQANGETVEVSLTPEQVVYLNPVLHFPEGETGTEVDCF
jgi:ribosome maturation factor RimP